MTRNEPDKESTGKNYAFVDGQNLFMGTAKMLSFRALELLSDPDSSLSLNKQFLQRLKVRLNRTSKSVAHKQIEKNMVSVK